MQINMVDIKPYKRRYWWLPGKDKYAYIPGYGDRPEPLIEALDKTTIRYCIHSITKWPHPYKDYLNSLS